MQWLKHIPITLWLTLAVFLMYGYTALLSGNYFAIKFEVLEFFGASQSAFTQGRFWAMVTSIFVHQDLIHLGLNIFSLVVIGTIFELECGRRHFLIIFSLSALLTLALSVIIFPASVFVGVSAAIFGLAGATIMRQLKSAVYGALFILVLFAFIPPLSFLAHGIGAVVGVLADHLLTRYNNTKNAMVVYSTVTR